MRGKRFTLLIGLCFVLSTAWALEGAPRERGRQRESKAIKATLLQYEKSLNNSDVNGILRLYAPDGVFMPSGAPTATGTEEIRAAYQHVLGIIRLDIKFTIDDIVQNGNYAFASTISRGKVTILAEGVTAPEENRELFVLQKRDGEWRIARYMFNKTTN